MAGTVWLALLGALSGLCGVAYEVLWARMLELQFGTSTLAVAVTVTAFMLGLALGSALLRTRAQRSGAPLRTLAWVEAIIGLFALALPALVRLCTPLIDAAALQLLPAQWHLLLMVAGLALLTLPAAAMGAGFPLLLEGWRRLGGSVGAAYGCNTLGAAAGALLPLLLLPLLGWNAAVRVVALLSLTVAAGLYRLQGRAPSRTEATGSPAREPAAAAALLIYGLIGAASLMLEMAWVRLFSLVMLRTEYVLALILSMMLLGIALGSLLASRSTGRGLLRILPWCACLCAIAGLWLLPAVSAVMERAGFSSLGGAMLAQALLLAVLTLPATLALGAWLPALSARLQVGAASLYSANSLGAALGALGFVLLLPHIGSPGVLLVSALLLLLAGLYLSGARRAWLAVPLVLVVAWPVRELPPASALLPRAFAGSHDLYTYEDAIAITQVVEQPDGQRVLLTDLRRRDASSEPTAVFTQANQALLPLALHAAPRTMLFLGIGTGISLAGSVAVEGLQRSAVELSAGSLVAAQEYFAPVNRGVLRQTRLYTDDPRHFLVASQERYDLIVGDLFHPDLAGAGALLSVEHFQRARRHLAAGGLFVQWLALNQFDPQSLAVVLRSFHEAFPDAQLFLDGMHLALVGPRDRWQGAGVAPAQQMTDAAEPQLVWLGRYFGPLAPAEGPLQHEWAPVIEFMLPRRHYDSHIGIEALLRDLLAHRPSVQQAARLLQVPDPQFAEFRRSYLGTELWVRSELAVWRGDVLGADHLLGLAYEADPQDRWLEYAVADRLLASLERGGEHGLSKQQLLQKIVIINPWSVEAWKALWRLQQAAGDAGEAASRARIQQLSPLDNSLGRP